MALRTLHLPSTLDTSKHDLIADFFAPCLQASVSYDRGVGYFSSGWVRLAAQGMAAFAANGGQARWITSPILGERDWEALSRGDEARRDSVLHDALQRGIDELEEALETDTLSALAWLVADGVLTFKLALPRHKLDQGDFHDKFGVFRDAAGDALSFSGSYNDSVQGTRNYESIKVFPSWAPATSVWAEEDAARFERLWAGNDPNVRVYDLPTAANERILRLRTDARPYVAPGAEPPTEGPSIPDTVRLRPYQELALDAWFEHGARGLLEMATGTGKTITALAGSSRLYEREGRLAVIVAAPYKHLVDQWVQEAALFGYTPVRAYGGRSRWHDDLSHQAVDFRAGRRAFLSVFATHATFASDAFQDVIARLDGPTLVIADEAHHLGAEHRRRAYPDAVPYRLALSATPDRWFDESGTDALRVYFGETVFTFGLAEAIGPYLTPYVYRPVLVPLSPEEHDEYMDLSRRIARAGGGDDGEGDERVKRLLMQRATLLNTAENKLPVLRDLVDDPADLRHTLFYCAPGQIDDVQSLLGWDLGARIGRFTAEESAAERQKILSQFRTSELQGLVAMKCLDEGVDVPSTRTAYLLASSSNPREFVQRRGRVLRKSPGKDRAVVVDLIAVPPEGWVPDRDGPSWNSERGIIRRELQRFAEFADLAINKHEALDVIWSLAKRYDLLDL